MPFLVTATGCLWCDYTSGSVSLPSTLHCSEDTASEYHQIISILNPQILVLNKPLTVTGQERILSFVVVEVRVLSLDPDRSGSIQN